MPWVMLGVLLFSRLPLLFLRVACTLNLQMFSLNALVAPDRSGVDVAPLLRNPGVRVNDQAVFLPFPVPAVVTPWIR